MPGALNGPSMNGPRADVALSRAPQCRHPAALAPDGPELGRTYCRYRIQLEVANGSATATGLPEFSITADGLVVGAAFAGAATTTVGWDFGDGSAPVHASSAQHTYARSGRYQITARLIAGSRLFEYRAVVIVSENHPSIAPLVVAPGIAACPVVADGTVPVTILAPAGTSGISLDCMVGTRRGWADSGAVTLHLPPGSHVMDFIATRDLRGRFHSSQRYLPDTPVVLRRGRIATNRIFDEGGIETTTLLNPLAEHLFGDGTVLSPLDRWTLQLPLVDNPWLASVTAGDFLEFDGSEFGDAILTLEFMS